MNRNFGSGKGILAAALGVLILAIAPSAGATLIGFELADHPDGNERPPLYGLRLDDGDSTNGPVNTFSFEDGSGNSTMSMTIDTVTGVMTISGTMRHSNSNTGGNDFSGEIWTLNASMQLLGTWNPATLEDTLLNNPSAIGTLVFDTGSVSLALDSGFSATEGYMGPTNWTGKANGSGDEFYLQWNHRTNDDVLTGNGWLMPVSGPMNGTSHDFLFTIVPGSGTPKTVVPEPATLSLLGLGLASLAVRRVRRKRTQ
ncbi:MAG: hypothetical protein AMXMBFR82_44430 [Candidatus Hydrogenedentota bacterium]